MKKAFEDIHKFFLNAMPYMVLLVVVLLLINIAKINGMQNDIAAIQQDIDYMHSDVSDLLEKTKNAHFDNSDVISVIRRHHQKISSQIDEAEREIKANTVIWSK